MKGNNTDVAPKDQTEEKVRIRAEYKGEEQSMRIDTSKIDKCASDNFQNIELKVKKKRKEKRQFFKIKQRWKNMTKD